MSYTEFMTLLNKESHLFQRPQQTDENNHQCHYKGDVFFSPGVFFIVPSMADVKFRIEKH